MVAEILAGVVFASAPVTDWAVRFKAAFVCRKGNSVEIRADGLSLQSGGGDFSVTQAGKTVDAGGGWMVRNRLFHDYVFARSGNRLSWWMDGDEMRTLDIPTDGASGFEIVTNGIEATVTGFQRVAGPLPAGWVPRNLIVNGGFEDVHEGYPVGWSTHTFGVNSLEDMADMDGVRARYRLDGDAFEGTRCMRIERVAGKKPLPLRECWRKRPGKTDMVFSVWLKADRPDVGVRLSLREAGGSAGSKTVFPGSRWQRYSVPCRTIKGSNAFVGIDVLSNGVVWADAAQLEKGHTPGAFETRAFKDLDYPPRLADVLDHYLPASYRPKPPKRVVPPPYSSRVDPVRNSFRTPGGEFFPFAVCLSSPFTGRDAFARALDALASWGFNTVELFHECFPKKKEDMRAMFDAAHARGLKLGVYLPYEKKTFAVSPRPLDLVGAVKDHPALLYVGMYDETWGRVKDEVKAANVAVVRRALGDVPVRYNEFDAGVVTHLDYSAADIASVDMYYVGNHDVSCMYYLLNVLRKDNPGRVVMYYPMASGRYTKDWMRDASPAEILAQAYAGYCQELFNIDWWIGLPLATSARAALLQARRERDAIGPGRFLDGVKTAVSCESDGDVVKFTARGDGTATTIIAYNASPRRVTARWKLPHAAETVDVLFENRKVASGGDVFTDVFEGNARHVYRISGAARTSRAK